MQFRTFITEQSHISMVRHAAMQLAVRCGFSEAATTRLDDAVAATASCLLSQKDGSGEILIRPLREEVSGLAAPRIEILALERYAADAHHGLSMLAPVAEEFSVHALAPLDSAKKDERAHIARMLISPSERFKPLGSGVSIGAICVPGPGEVTRCQPWQIEYLTPGGFNLTLLHGLGHSAESHRLTVAAHRAAGSCAATAPGVIAARIRAALGTHVTPNMALSVATLDTARKHLCLVGGGEISAILARPGEPLYRPPATLVDQAKGFDIEWPEGSLLVLYAGDFSKSFTLPDAAIHLDVHPAVLATMLYRDYLAQDGSGTIIACRHQAVAQAKAVARQAVQAAGLEEN
jgi:hypothetical protein